MYIQALPLGLGMPRERLFVVDQEVNGALNKHFGHIINQRVVALRDNDPRGVSHTAVHNSTAHLLGVVKSVQQIPNQIGHLISETSANCPHIVTSVRRFG